MTFNYYKATFSVVTARQAQRMGIRISRPNGYYVLIDPPVTTEARRPGTERIQAWCKSSDELRPFFAIHSVCGGIDLLKGR